MLLRSYSPRIRSPPSHPRGGTRLCAGPRRSRHLSFLLLDVVAALRDEIALLKTVARNPAARANMTIATTDDPNATIESAIATMEGWLAAAQAPKTASLAALSNATASYWVPEDGEVFNSRVGGRRDLFSQ